MWETENKEIEKRIKILTNVIKERIKVMIIIRANEMGNNDKLAQFEEKDNLQ